MGYELLRFRRRAVHQQTQHKSFRRPDELRGFSGGCTEVVTVSGMQICRYILQPGWRRSDETQRGALPHFQYHVSGRLGIRMSDGTEYTAGPGDVTSLPADHEAWVVGDEPVVVVDWYAASAFAPR